MADKQYTVLHEIGDYFRGSNLNETDNKAYNEQMREKTQKNEKDLPKKDNKNNF